MSGQGCSLKVLRVWSLASIHGEGSISVMILETAWAAVRKRTERIAGIELPKEASPLLELYWWQVPCLGIAVKTHCNSSTNSSSNQRVKGLCISTVLAVAEILALREGKQGIMGQTSTCTRRYSDDSLLTMRCTA